MAVRPEMIGDVEEGEAPAGGRDEMGFTPSERAEWNAMEASAKEAPQGEPEGEAAPEGSEPAPAEGAVKPEGDAPAEGEDEGEDVLGEQPDPKAAVDPKNGKPPQKHVSWQKHQRLLAARDAKLTAAEQRIQTESEQRIKLAERLAILNEALTAPAPVDPVKAQEAAVAANPLLEPDIAVEDDALGAIAQLQRRNAYLHGQLTTTTETTQATLEDRQLKDDYERDVSQFRRSEEGQHWDAAYQYLKDSRLREMSLSMFDKDPTDPAQIFTQAEISRLVQDFNAEEKWVVNNAKQNGKSIAASVMKIAKIRGFKPQAAQAAPAAQVPAVAPAKNGNGAAPVVPSAVAKILAETEGAAASRSLSDGGGAPPIEALTPERLLKMPDAEFARYVDSLPKEHLDSIMGRPMAGAR